MMIDQSAQSPQFVVKSLKSLKSEPSGATEIFVRGFDGSSKIVKVSVHDLVSDVKQKIVANYLNDRLMGPYGTRNKAKHDVTLLHRNLPTNTENLLGVIGTEASPTSTVALALLLIAASFNYCANVSPHKRSTRRRRGNKMENSVVGGCPLALYVTTKPQSAKGLPSCRKAVAEFTG